MLGGTLSPQGIYEIAYFAHLAPTSSGERGHAKHMMQKYIIFFLGTSYT